MIYVLILPGAVIRETQYPITDIEKEHADEMQDQMCKLYGGEVFIFSHMTVMGVYCPLANYGFICVPHGCYELISGPEEAPVINSLSASARKLASHSGDTSGSCATESSNVVA